MSLTLPRSPVHDCLFCCVASLPEGQLPWHDRPVIKEPGIGAVIPAVGAFVPGYVLISPAQHRSSLQNLPAEVAFRFVDFVGGVLARIEAIFGPATIFEHGSCRSEERRRSACLTHSHIHIVPGAYSFGTLGLPVRLYGGFSDLLLAGDGEKLDGYLMFREPGGPVCYAPDLGVSQYFRRHIARVLDCPDEWDYALFPRWDNVRVTQDRLLGTLLTSADLTTLT